MDVFRVTWLSIVLALFLLIPIGCKEDETETRDEPRIGSLDAPCTGVTVTLYGENLTIALPFVDGIEATILGTPTDSEMLIEPPVFDLGEHEVTVRSSYSGHAGYVSPGLTYSVDALAVGIDRIEAVSGPSCGGDYVEIHGQNFPDSYTVSARASDGTEDNFFAVSTRVSETLISGITAPHEPGPYELIVANPGVCASEGSISYTFEDIQCTGSLASENLLSFDVGAGPHGVAIGDVSGDGHNDVVVGSTSPGRVTVLQGNGGGAFVEYEVDLSTSDGPLALAIADIDEDGRSDVVAAVDPGRSVRVLLQNTSGILEFRSDLSLSPGASPDDMVAVDGNGDGHIDVITANGGSGLSVFWGVGDGTFEAELEVSSVGAYDIAAGDYRANATDAVDLAVASTGGGIYSFVWNAAGTGTWEGSALTTVSFTPVDVILADAGTVVDTALTLGVGTDLLVLGKSDATLGVLYGVEDGLADYFAQHTLTGTPVVFERVAIYVEGLFLFQVLAAYESGRMEVISILDGGAEPGLISSLELGAAPFAIAVGKLDGGDTDDFVVGMETGAQIYIHVTP